MLPDTAWQQSNFFMFNYSCQDGELPLLRQEAVLENPSRKWWFCCPNCAAIWPLEDWPCLDRGHSWNKSSSAALKTKWRLHHSRFLIYCRRKQEPRRKPMLSKTVAQYHRRTGSDREPNQGLHRWQTYPVLLWRPLDMLHEVSQYSGVELNNLHVPTTGTQTSTTMTTISDSVWNYQEKISQTKDGQNKPISMK
jgi:hypothetical protein